MLLQGMNKSNQEFIATEGTPKKLLIIPAKVKLNELNICIDDTRIRDSILKQELQVMKIKISEDREKMRKKIFEL